MLQDLGQRIDPLTNGRMSTTDGTVLAAFHVVPEAADSGMIGLLRDGDRMVIDTFSGEMSVDLDTEALDAREADMLDLEASARGCGREWFAGMRAMVNDAEHGACTLFFDRDDDDD